MNINPRFIEYFKSTFFSGKEDEFGEFLISLEKSIPRTLRIKPDRVEEVKKRLESYGFVLSQTYIPNVFSLDRNDDFDPLERRIWFTLDHLVWNFYIQELAAATSVQVLSDGKIHNEPYLILDMASSPGGKTTQLSEHYPNAFIIANEPTRERIPQLLQNLDRMWSSNIWVTLYPGQFFRHSPETFDRILLDAPCSGEWTLYKGTLATKHWHIKNIKNIASLQEKLFEAALISLKVSGEMVYSTCSMNLLENEWVIQKIEGKYPNSFEILSQKRFWPHKDGTGWFFVARIRKNKPIENHEKTRPENSNTKIEKIGDTGINETIKPNISIYSHEWKLLAVKNNEFIDTIRKKYYFMRFWEKFGQIEKWITDFGAFSHRYIETDGIQKYEIANEGELDLYLRWGKLNIESPTWPIILTYQGIIISLENIEKGICSNRFPHEWIRK